MDQPQVGGAPPAHPRRSGFLAGMVAGVVGAGVVAGLILAGLNMAGAQTNSPSATPSSNSGSPPSGFPGPWFGHGQFGFGFGALHGQFTTTAPGGGYQTLATQYGQVTAVSSSSITIRSEDGFTSTYSVDDNTLVNAGNNGIADVKNGDTVRVAAVVNNGKAHAVQIIDETQVQRSTGRWLPPLPGAPST